MSTYEEKLKTELKGMLNFAGTDRALLLRTAITEGRLDGRKLFLAERTGFAGCIIAHLGQIIVPNEELIISGGCDCENCREAQAGQRPVNIRDVDPSTTAWDDIITPGAAPFREAVNAQLAKDMPLEEPEENDGLCELERYIISIYKGTKPDEDGRVKTILTWVDEFLAESRQEPIAVN